MLGRLKIITFFLVTFFSFTIFAEPRVICDDCNVSLYEKALSIQGQTGSGNFTIFDFYNNQYATFSTSTVYEYGERFTLVVPVATPVATIYDFDYVAHYYSNLMIAARSINIPLSLADSMYDLSGTPSVQNRIINFILSNDFVITALDDFLKATVLNNIYLDQVNGVVIETVFADGSLGRWMVKPVYVINSSQRFDLHWDAEKSFDIDFNVPPNSLGTLEPTYHFSSSPESFQSFTEFVEAVSSMGGIVNSSWTGSGSQGGSCASQTTPIGGVATAIVVCIQK